MRSTFWATSSAASLGRRSIFCSCGPKFEGKILSFYITGLAQFFTQLSLKGHSIGIGVPYDKYTNATYVGLLCTRTEWPHQPGDNAAKQ
jgi:hypothetical protein